MSALDDAVRWKRDLDRHADEAIHGPDRPDFDEDLHEEVAHELDNEGVKLLARAVDEENERRAAEPRNVLDSKMGAWERVGPDAYVRVSFEPALGQHVKRLSFLEIAQLAGIRHCS